MLIDYKFSNFLSFKDECNLSMLASADQSHKEHIIDNGKNKCLKFKVFFGANASGKTAFIDSVRNFKRFIKSNANKQSSELISTHPFKFLPNYKERPSSYELTFKYKGLKYNYSFSRTPERVISEELKVYYSSKPTVIFSKLENGKYKLLDDNKNLRDIVEKTAQNKLLLTMADIFSYEKVKDVIEYFNKNIVVVYDIDRLSKNLLDSVMNDNYADYKDFVLNMLTKFDIGISDFEIESKKFKDVEGLEQISPLLSAVSQLGTSKRNDFLNSNLYNITTYHKITDENGETNIYDLNLNSESLGTKSLFLLAPILYDVLKNGKVMFVDELDKSLHPIIVKQIVKMFLDEEINTNNAQLICNTHESTLLDLEFLRRDEIMFVDKDYKTGASSIYSLSDFSIRKDEKVLPAYFLGRYGATPFIQEGF